MAAPRKSPGDFTGRQTAKATAEAQAELAERRDQIAMAQAVDMEIIETDVFDPTSGESLGKFEVVELEIDHSPSGKKESNQVIIRVIEDIDDMVFGVGNHYTFKAGQKYKVDKVLAEHLDQCGYLLGVM
jgi:hypothetical protein